MLLLRLSYSIRISSESLTAGCHSHSGSVTFYSMYSVQNDLEGDVDA